MLVVKQQDPLSLVRERIIVPRQVLDGTICALHIQLEHPTEHQLKTVVHRYLFALDMDKAIERATKGCHSCAALKTAPKTVQKQSSGDPPESVGITFAADVMKRERQLILVVRECVTSYTLTCHLESERHEVLRDALIKLCVELCPLDGPPAVIRTDPAPGFQALANDAVLRQHRICTSYS